MNSFIILVSPRRIIGSGSATGGPYRNSPSRAHSGTLTISPTAAKKTPPPLQCEGPCFYLKSYVFKTITISPATDKADVCYDS